MFIFQRVSAKILISSRNNLVIRNFDLRADVGSLCSNTFFSECLCNESFVSERLCNESFVSKRLCFRSFVSEAQLFQRYMLLKRNIFLLYTFLSKLKRISTLFYKFNLFQITLRGFKYVLLDFLLIHSKDNQGGLAALKTSLMQFSLSYFKVALIQFYMLMSF